MRDAARDSNPAASHAVNVVGGGGEARLVEVCEAATRGASEVDVT